jgi:Glycosyl hydrolase family 9/Cellulase N-terminal ig-like domain
MTATARRSATAAGLAAVVAGLVGVAARAPATPVHAVRAPLPRGTAAQLRVDQLGYAAGGQMLAYLMTGRAIAGERWQLLDSSGAVAASGAVSSAGPGAWNPSYPDVYELDFSGVQAAGSYRLAVAGPVALTSDRFQIEPAAALYAPLVGDGVDFFRNQRDGPNVIAGPLHRRPSHLRDARALVYADPAFKGGGSDVIRGSLHRIGGPVDVAGGWFDAGDYLKFTFTASYADSILYAAARALGARAPASLLAEARYGTRWLDRIWRPRTRTLYLQVGIGSGNETTFYGDHDLWRLPQADDSDHRRIDRFAARSRPVFEAAPPGSRIDPDIAGRVVAALAFAAQADARAGRRARAAAELRRALALYRLADTDPRGRLASTLPSSYYPETIWHDAMELAATEVVLAEQDLGYRRHRYLPMLRRASRWAADYIARDSGADTLNLYDVSALAHADLITAIARAGSPPGLAVGRAGLVANLRAQLAGAASRASASIFHLGGDETNFDVDSHTFGLISTEALYRRASGDAAFTIFAGEQRDWLFGANPWGESFMVGVGTSYPDCMQSQIPNLAGSLDGTPPIDTGAVVNGPNNPSNFAGGLGGLQSGMRRCENDSGEAFTGHSAEFVDDVRAWQTDEPALDMSASAILAAALQESAPAS